MLGQAIEAVFENGIFRPLQPVHLPEHQRVTLLLPATEGLAADATCAETEESDEDVPYEPLPWGPLTTIRVRVRQVADLGPVPYPIEADEPEQG